MFCLVFNLSWDLCLRLNLDLGLSAHENGSGMQKPRNRALTTKITTAVIMVTE